MSARAPAGGAARRALGALAALMLLAGLGAGVAHGERTQHGNLIVALDGGLTPLKLPRDHPAPVAVHLAGGLRTADGELLPRVTRVELGLPKQGVLSSRGLPTCSQRRLRDTTSAKARELCGGALVGSGTLQADVLLPNQDPFTIEADLLAFNGRVEGRRAVILHAAAAKPPTVVVLPFVLRRREGTFGLAMVADLPPTLGPWPHFAHFELTLSRRYTYRGQERSYLSASCPAPPRFTAGFLSFARVGFTLVGGRQVGAGIVRGCRAR
ncbi:MAG TPA: hypothetical protein VEW07_13810 [Solirubrobacterales bacterium]|nr:hypothetical protein [Solirubrobacterales bacterium]